MTGFAVERFDGGGLHDLSRVHHRRPVRDVLDDAQIVGDDKAGGEIRAWRSSG